MDKNHKWYSVARKWLDGAEIEYRRRLGPYATWSDWSLAEYPHWHDSPNDEYRVRSKWQKEKEAWSKGQLIQWRPNHTGAWRDMRDGEIPMWWENQPVEYRVKPEPIIHHVSIVYDRTYGYSISTRAVPRNVKIELDPDTNELIDIEIHRVKE